MSLRTTLLYELSRRRMPKPVTRTVDYEAYQDWRRQSLTSSWSAFQGIDLRGKDILDFGCGDGALSLFLATQSSPASVTGIDLNADAIERANEAKRLTTLQLPDRVNFIQGSVDGLPVTDGSVDVLVAFDCLEHVMSPLPIFRDWFRVLRPGGKCLLEWFPFKGPWGPHMEVLIPVPWAHVLFGQAAMFRAAERLYDLPQFVPRHWDMDANGKKKPNKWKQWSSFKEQGYVNELDVKTFHDLVQASGLEVSRFETHSFGGSPIRKALGRTLMRFPVLGEYFVSYTVIELQRPGK